MNIRQLALLLLLLVSNAARAAEPVSFNRDVLPILAEHCFSCHGFDKAARQANLRLDRRDDAWRVLSRENSSTSELVRRVQESNAEERMPPASHGKPLTIKQIDLLQKWVEEGAHYEAHWAWLPVQTQRKRTNINSSTCGSAIDGFIEDAIRANRPQLIGISLPAEPAALLRRLTFDMTGLPPTLDETSSFNQDDRPDAYERRVDRLLASPRFGERWSRWWLDLAHYADSEGYLQDFLRPNAWRYRDWVVDSFNSDKPFDQFTIEQLAGDLLADKLEQASNGKPSATDAQKVRQLRVATGFYRNTLSNREGGADLEEYRVRQVVDRTNTVATTWLSLTLGCAECHDHKYDPITQRDYYRFYAFFNDLDEVNINAEDVTDPQREAMDEFYQWRSDTLSGVRVALDELLVAWEEKLLWTEQHPGADHRWDRHLEVLGLIWGQGEGEGQLEGLNIVKTPRTIRTRDEQALLEEYFFQRGSAIDPDHFKSLGLEKLASEIDKRRAALPKLSRAQTVRSARRHRETHVHSRGDFRLPTDLVTPAIPALFQVTDSTIAAVPPAGDGRDGYEIDDRLKLASWLVSNEQSLTSRVTVNRLWQELFGRGLVATSENIGVRGQRPTHPELLDWLSTDFVQHGWSLKSILRSLVLSDVYRQSSAVTNLHQRHDPQNIYMARQARLRLNAEAVRDMTLATCGLLDNQINGPSVRPPQPESVAMEGFDNKWEVDKGAGRYRRGLYTFIQRTSPFAQAITFDLPETSRACSRRERSNTPLQALTLLNDPVLFEATIHMAVHLMRSSPEAGESADRERLNIICLRILGRTPSETERAKLTRHLNEQRHYFRSDAEAARRLLSGALEIKTDNFDTIELAAWAMTCSVLLNLDEAITRD